jgi:hypothetical protein
MYQIQYDVIPRPAYRVAGLIGESRIKNLYGFPLKTCGNDKKADITYAVINSNCERLY